MVDDDQFSDQLICVFLFHMQTKNLKRICGELAEMNKDLAVSNLALKPELQLLKNRLVAQGEEQNLLKSTYSSNQEKIGMV